MYAMLYGMNLSQIFEGEVLSKKFESIDAAKKFMGSHPQAGEYIFSHLLARDFISVHADWSVGPSPGQLARSETPMGPKRGRNHGVWGETWPNRETCLDAVKAIDPVHGIKYKVFQMNLSESGTKVGFWMTGHILRYFIGSDVLRFDATTRTYYPNNGAPLAPSEATLPSANIQETTPEAFNEAQRLRKLRVKMLDPRVNDENLDHVEKGSLAWLKQKSPAPARMADIAAIIQGRFGVIFQPYMVRQMMGYLCVAGILNPGAFGITDPKAFIPPEWQDAAPALPSSDPDLSDLQIP